MMKLTALTYCITLSITLLGSMPCQGGSIIYGTSIDVSGDLKVLDGSLIFPDGTFMTSASSGGGGVWGFITGNLSAQTDLVNYVNSFVFESLVWGEITGEIANQIDLSSKFTTKQDLVEKNKNNGYAGLDDDGRLLARQMPIVNPVEKSVPVFNTSPTWQNQGFTWVELPEYTTAFNRVRPYSDINLHLTDSVGVSGFAWCNLGIFINDATTPVCYGSWTGSYSSNTFQQINLDCIVPYLHLPEHSTIRVKHRSEFCAYGNYWTDEFSTMRKLTIKELI